MIFTEAAIRSELKKCGNILNESSILDKFVGKHSKPNLKPKGKRPNIAIQQSRISSAFSLTDISKPKQTHQHQLLIHLIQVCINSFSFTRTKIWRVFSVSGLCPVLSSQTLHHSCRGYPYRSDLSPLGLEKTIAMVPCSL